MLIKRTTHIVKYESTVVVILNIIFYGSSPDATVINLNRSMLFPYAYIAFTSIITLWNPYIISLTLYSVYKVAISLPRCKVSVGSVATQNYNYCKPLRPEYWKKIVHVQFLKLRKNIGFECKRKVFNILYLTIHLFFFYTFFKTVLYILKLFWNVD